MTPSTTTFRRATGCHRRSNRSARLRCFALGIIALGLAGAVRSADLPSLPQVTVPLAPVAHDFHFVVLGDSQFDDPPAFNRIVNDVAALRPAFVIQVGDMIDGYQDDASAIRAQWQRFRHQLAPLDRIRFFPVPGNHDVYGEDRKPSSMLNELYERQWGKLHYSFVHQNARFLILNSDPISQDNSIDPAQLAWLARELDAASKQDHIFVFLHRPPAALRNGDALHSLLKQHVPQLKFVFFGHYHHYEQHERDGISYVMTNAAGDSSIDFAATGSKDHLLHVSVRDDQVGYVAIHANSMTHAGTITPADNSNVYRLERGLHRFRQVRATALDTPGAYRATLRLPNAGGTDVTAFIQCDSPDGRWSIAPTRAVRVDLPAGALETSVAYKLTRPDGSSPEGWPFCDIEAPVPTSSGQWVRVQQRVAVEPPP